jgi:HSP20 family protein
MKLTKLTPPGAVARRDFDEVLDRFLGTPYPFTPFGTESIFRTPEGFWTPAVDLAETEKDYIVRMEIPGVPRENLDVHLEGNVLMLTGHRDLMKKETVENYLWEERETGKFMRTIRLPKAVDAAKVEATCNEGILTVKLPKQETAIKNKIVIKG